MRTPYKSALVAVFGILLSSATAFATVPVLDPAVGHALDGILAVAGRSRLAPAMRPVAIEESPLELARAEKAVALVRSASGHRFRYRATRVVLVAGKPGEPNAFCTGPSIYVGRELVRTLNDRQLTAVLAHEMGHAERGHLTSRMTFGFAAALVHFGRLARGEARALEGHVDAFMRELQKRGHWAIIQDMMQAATLGQELQADCLAYGWLENMRKAGLEERGDDLGDAMLGLLGLTEKMLEGDDFMGARLRAIRSGADADGRCD